jgi:hypothetical protein
MPAREYIPNRVDFAFQYNLEKLKPRLAAKIGELASLHFSLLLTARWESEERSDLEERSRLREDLASLRELYYDKLDEIAMSFGLQMALDAKKSVERRLTPSGSGDFPVRLTQVPVAQA